MESFFLAETTKYLFLLFDTDNFIHNQGQHGTIINTPNGECVIEAGGYIFNTEAHPIDPSTLYCCHDMPKQRLFDFSKLNQHKSIFRGETIEERKSHVELLSENNPESMLKDVNTSETKSDVEIEVGSENVREMYQSKGSVEALSEDNLNKVIFEYNESNSKIKNSQIPTDKPFRENSLNKETDLANTTLFREDIEYNYSLIHKTISQLLPNMSDQQKHDPQQMLERIRTENRYRRNVSSENNYNLLSCKAQPFLQRLSILGEFFNR